MVSFLQVSPPKLYLHLQPTPNTCPTYLNLLDWSPSNMWWGEQLVKTLIMRFTSVCSYFHSFLGKQYNIVCLSNIFSLYYKLRTTRDSEKLPTDTLHTMHNASNHWTGVFDSTLSEHQACRLCFALHTRISRMTEYVWLISYWRVNYDTIYRPGQTEYFPIIYTWKEDCM